MKKDMKKDRDETFTGDKWHTKCHNVKATVEAAKAFSTELKIIIQNDEYIKDLISSEIVTELY